MDWRVLFLIVQVCPKCGNGVLRFSIKSGYEIDFDLKKSNEFVFCQNCKRKISYSVQPKNPSDSIKNPQ